MPYPVEPTILFQLVCQIELRQSSSLSLLNDLQQLGRFDEKNAGLQRNVVCTTLPLTVRCFLIHSVITIILHYSAFHMLSMTLSIYILKKDVSFIAVSGKQAWHSLQICIPQELRTPSWKPAMAELDERLAPGRRARIEIVMACPGIILREKSLSVGNSPLRSSSPTLNPTKQPTKLKMCCVDTTLFFTIYVFSNLFIGKINPRMKPLELII